LTIVTPLLEAGSGPFLRSGSMAVRQVRREELRRLECKTLDAQIKATIGEGTARSNEP